MPLDGEIARRMIAASHAKADEIGVAVSTALFDAEGRLYAFGRMNRAHWGSIEMAQSKAFTGSMLRRDGVDIKELPSAMLASVSMMQGRALIGAGSITTLSEGDVVIAAIGCSGATDDEDGECARAARDAYFG